MQIQILKAKIKELIVSESSVDYPGSIALPEELLQAAGIRQFEMVYVNNKTNGNRITTYAVKSMAKGFVTVNGAASKLFNKGDIIHVLAYRYINEEEYELFQPQIVLANEHNELIESKLYIF
jgi:aspartate 1-decarboxylase